MALSETDPKTRSTMEEAKLVHFLSSVDSMTNLPQEVKLKLSRLVLCLGAEFEICS